MKSHTDLEQSKKLAEILPIEGADHHYVRKTCDSMGNPVDGKWSIPKYGNPNSSHANYMVMGFMNYEIISCWSLAALFNVIPKHIKDYNVLRIDISENDFAIWYDEVGFGVNNDLPDITADNPIDACVEMILKLYEQKLL